MAQCVLIIAFPHESIYSIHYSFKVEDRLSCQGPLLLPRIMHCVYSPLFLQTRFCWRAQWIVSLNISVFTGNYYGTPRPVHIGPDSPPITYQEHRNLLRNFRTRSKSLSNLEKAVEEGDNSEEDSGLSGMALWDERPDENRADSALGSSVILNQ